MDDTPGSCLVWGYIQPSINNNAVFERIQLSDGASLSNVTGVQVTGQSNINVDIGDPNTISNSCPVWVLVDALGLPPEPTPDYHIRKLTRRRVRRAPIVWAEKDGLQTRVRVNLFAVDMQPGIATADVPNPKVMVRASKDSGHTWTDYREIEAGRVGEYTKRLNSWRWGSGRDWVFEVVCTDDVAWYLVNAYIDAEPGIS